MSRIPLYCERCSMLRAVDTWRETSPQTLVIALSPCGHEQERTAGEEWRRSPDRHAATVTSIASWPRQPADLRCVPATRTRHRTATH